MKLKQQSTQSYKKQEQQQNNIKKYGKNINIKRLNDFLKKEVNNENIFQNKKKGVLNDRLK